MQRLSVILFVTLLAVSNIYAQSKFEQGHIVTLDNRVVRGMIDYRNWSRNPETILFRDDELKNETMLGVNDIAGFRVHGEIYERAVVSRNLTVINGNDLPENSLPVLEQDTVFLLTLADGTKGFQYLKDRSGKIQLYIGADHELLVYHKYKIVRDNQTKIVTIDRYRQQIKAYLNCPDIDSHINNLGYSNKEILNLFKLYYKKCSTVKPETLTKREGLGFEMGASAGVTASKLSFTGYNFPYLTDYKHDVSTRPVAGLFLNIVIPRTRKTLIIANELAYSSYKISGHYRTEVNAENFTTTDFTFALNHVRLNNLVRYRINRDKAFFYISAGLSNGFLISEDNRYIARTQFYTDVHEKEDKALETRKHDQGFIVGIGAGFRKLGLEFRYENSNGNSNYFSITSNVKRGVLLVHYKF